MKVSNSHEDTTIRTTGPSDAVAIASIYNYYVTETVVTFEEEPVAAAEIARRIEDVRSASLPWLVAEEGSHLVGYAYATPWRTRSGYRFSTEVTVYLAPEHAGRGIGSKLYRQPFPLLQTRGIHAVMGGISLPNEASIALHEKFGMRKVAHFEAAGFKFNRWIDVGYWQRTFQGEDNEMKSSIKTLSFETLIHAPREKVWNTMLAPDTYRIWTAEFTKGSYFEGSWEKGERVRFLDPKGGGMIAVIAENRPHEFLSIKHLGEIKNGVEDTENDEVRKWAPAFENYTLTDAGSGTQIKVSQEVTPDFEDYMNKTWPKALAKLKMICESRTARNQYLG